MVNDNILYKVLHKIKDTTYIVEFDDYKILIDTDNKLPDYYFKKSCDINIMCR